MKILLVCEQYLPSKKRAGRPNYSLKYLPKWGHDLTIVCPKPKEENIEEIPNVNFEYINYDFEQFSIYKRIKIYFAFKKKLKNLLSKEKFDIIRSINIMPTYACLSIKKRPKIFADLVDFISDLYVQFDLPFKSIAAYYLKRIEKIIAKKVDFGNVETPFGRRLWKELGANEKKIVIIPNGVDTKHFMENISKIKNLRKKLSLHENDKIIIYHGDFGKLDGIDFLIKTLKYLNESVKLLIIGSGEKKYEKYLKNLTNKLNLNQRIIFTGWIEYEYLPSYLNLANVFSFPIIPETRINYVFHAKIKEYLCFRKPFVITEVEGLKWVLRDIPFYIKDPKNVKELALKIKEALEKGINEEKSIRMIKIAEKLDWSNIIKKDEMFMKAIVNNQVDDSSKFDIELSK